MSGAKIVWPEEWSSMEYASARFLYSVDGVHCRTNEIIHSTLAKNKKLYSHKFNQAGLGYELAISLTRSSLAARRAILHILELVGAVRVLGRRRCDDSHRFPFNEILLERNIGNRIAIVTVPVMATSLQDGRFSTSSNL